PRRPRPCPYTTLFRSLVAILRADAEQRPVECSCDPVWRVDDEEAAAMHQRHAIAAPRFVHVRRRDDGRQALILEAAEEIPELARSEEHTSELQSHLNL